MLCQTSLNPRSLISCTNVLCSCDCAVAGTNITALALPFLYNTSFFFSLCSSCSSIFHPFGQYNGLSPLRFYSCLTLNALTAESTTWYRSYLLYPENCIRRVNLSTFLTTRDHGSSGLVLISSSVPSLLCSLAGPICNDYRLR